MPVVDKRPKADVQQENAPRPFWILDKPIQLITRDNRPFYGSALKIVDGPEIIESGWWDDATEIRKYYVAQGTDGTCYWLFQDRSVDPIWHLHGFFA
jgi:protein ImuB